MTHGAKLEKSDVPRPELQFWPKSLYRKCFVIRNVVMMQNPFIRLTVWSI